MLTQVENIIIKHLSGNSTPEEDRMLHEWLKEEDNLQIFDQIKTNWELCDLLVEPSNKDTTEAWESIAALTVGKQAPKKVFPNWLKIALPAAAVILLTFFIWQTVDTSHKKYLSVVASSNNQEVSLPDESKVWLRNGSEIVYTEKDNQRIAHLKGDAIFHITPNKERPFFVRNQQAHIRVVGTQFAVHKIEEGIHVGVTEGIVEVGMDGAEWKPQLLTANQQAMLTSTSIVTDTLLHNNHLYWQTSELQFISQPLDVVLQSVSEVLKADIVFNDDVPKELREQKITTTFKSQQVEDILTELCLISHCNWEKQGNKYLVYAK